MEKRPSTGATEHGLGPDEDQMIVLDIVRRLEALRSRGLSPVQMAERIRLSHPLRPDGGTWTPASVERILHVADVNRRAQVLEPIERSEQRSHDRNRTAGFDPNRDPRSGGYRAHRSEADLDSPENDPQDRRWPLLIGLMTLAGIAAVSFGLYRTGAIDRLVAGEEGAGSVTTESIDSAGDTGRDNGEATEGDDSSTDSNTAGASTVTTSSDVSIAASSAAVDDGVAASDGNGDTLVLRIEPGQTTAGGGLSAATATVRTDGKLHIEGAFRSEEEAQRYLNAAEDVFGEAALVPGFTIDPAAPDPEVSDVVLEKPVLFKSGSAEIDPEYVPFLAACGDVLKLNPEIVMSVAAFTDASGDEQFNLELSQRRADAVIEFYRNLDIEDDQLISIGFGESDFVADNDTETGRAANRRAILELLNVMDEA